MTTRKRNEYLDLPSDEEDGQDGYDSEEVEISGAAKGSKRRKTAAEEPEDDDIIVSEEDEEAKDGEMGPGDDDGEDHEASDAEDDDLREAADTPKLSTIKPSTRPKPSTLTTKSLDTLARRAVTANSKSLKTGVLYLSRIPPFLKPSALRSLLLPYAPHGLNRLFLTPEDPTSHRSRIRSGGNKKRTFTDGWVEFNSKRDAKIAAETLNTRIIGGKKGGWYHDDVWNVKYLRGFKWRHLTEQTNSENAERAARMRVEIRRTTRENKNFEANVERAKKMEGVERTRARRGDDGAGGGKVGNVEEKSDGKRDEGKRKKEFAFRQNAIRKQGGGIAKDQSEEVKRVLSKIF